MDDAKNRTEDVNRTVNNTKQYCGNTEPASSVKKTLVYVRIITYKLCYLCKNNFVSYECVTTKNKTKISFSK